MEEENCSSFQSGFILDSKGVERKTSEKLSYRRTPLEKIEQGVSKSLSLEQLRNPQGDSLGKKKELPLATSYSNCFRSKI